MAPDILATHSEMSSPFRVVSVENHTLYAPAGDCAGLRAKIGPIMQESHPKPSSAAFTPARRRAPPAGPGLPAERKGRLRPWLEELGIEHQLQLARRFRLGLPVLGLEELGIGDELRISRFARASV